MWDGAKIMPDAITVNGFTEAECRNPDKGSLQDLVANFYHWIEQCEDKTLAGQNVSFDRDFLNDSFSRSNMSWHFSFRTLDLHSMAYMDATKRGFPIAHKNDRSDLSLDTILKYLGLPEEPKPHHALNGAKYEAECFSRILFSKNLLPEFKEFPILHK